MDPASKTVESRNPRSVFSEVGYYPEQLERDLCDNIERDFALCIRKLFRLATKWFLMPMNCFC